MRMIDAHLTQEIADRELPAREAGAVRLVLSRTPTIEAEPEVVRQWVKDRDTIKCPVCGFGMYPIPYAFQDGVCVGGPLIPKHCPGCGVKLEIEE